MTKKLGLTITTIFFLSAVLLLGVCAFPTHSLVEANADTTIALSSAQDLIELSESVNDGNSRHGEVFSLSNDIDLSDTDFFPIGTGTIFHGTIIGNGHSITVALNGEWTKSAFVGSLGSSGAIRNLILRGSVNGNSYVGGIVADSEGLIENCVSFVDLTISSSSNSYTGGIVGNNKGRINGCVYKGDIVGLANIGGIAGVSQGTVQNCVSFGTINATGIIAMEIGGIVGSAYGSIKDCYSLVNITLGETTERNNVGSIVGSSTYVETQYNYALETAYSFPSEGSIGNETVGVFENATEYEFLSESGLTFSGSGYKRASFIQGYGYLYVPEFLTEENSEGKTIIVNSEYAEIFKMSLFGIGRGTEDEPFILNSLEEWKLFVTNSKLYNYSETYIQLGKSLDIGETNSIGCEEVPFAGFFNGNGHYIRLENNDSKNNAGLFSFVSDSIIENLTVKGSMIGGTAVSGLIANAAGAVTVRNTINECDITSKSNLGGIVGYANENSSLNLFNCANKAEIICIGVKDDGKAGGLIGKACGAINASKVVNYGGVSAENGGTKGIGGIAGEIVTSSGRTLYFDGVHNEGKIIAVRSDGVGGIVGKISGTGVVSIISASMLADIKGKTYVSGILGEAMQCSINNFAVIGDIVGENYVSGVANSRGGDLILTKGYYSGNIVEKAESGVEVFNEDAISVNIAGETIADEVYYNGDCVNKGTTVESVDMKNYIQLTSGELFLGDALMTEAIPLVTSGGFPYPTANQELITKTECLVVFFFDGTEGTGENTYYLIKKENVLRNFAFLCSEKIAYRNYKYKLIGDITLTRDFMPIPVFSGELDGDGYKINNYNVNFSQTECGLFGNITNAYIHDLGLYGGIITVNVVNATAGAICGTMDENSTIEGCYANIDINGAFYAGGIVGNNQGSLINSFYAGKIYGGANAGGLVGQNSGTIENCFFSGKISASSSIGGLVGVSNGGNITLCYASGRLDGNGNSGGIIANAVNTTVNKTFVLSDMVASGTSGAFFAQVDETTKNSLSQCYFNNEKISHLAYPGIATVNDGINVWNGTYGKIEEFFRVMNSDNFNVTGFNRFAEQYNAYFDSYYAPYLAIFEKYLDKSNESYNSVISDIVGNSVELNIFGRDTSSDEIYGGERNPYLITNAKQFSMLATLTKETSFLGKYFKVTNDIDMNTTSSSGYAIGYYSPLKGNPFCGVIYGDKQNRPTISNINVNKAENDDGEITKSYLGVFANTEEGFALKNVILKGKVIGETHLGGVIGYSHKGVIENVLSYINVSATGAGASGMVGAVSAEISVVGSICVGLPTATSDIYGLLGINSNTSGISVKTLNSWFVLKGSEATGYIHNSYGSVMYDYSDSIKGESLSIISNQDQGFGFIANSTTEYKGYVLDTGDNFITTIDGSAFFDTSNDDISRYYYIRYCKKITSKAIYNNKETNYATVTADDKYYIGQSVKVNLSWTNDGKEKGVKFVNLLDKEGADVPFTLEPSAYDVFIGFTMTENTTEIRVVVDEITSGEVLSFNVISGTEYSGESRNPTINIAGSDAEYFLVSGESKTEIKDAGIYRIVIRITDENGEYIGLYETQYEIQKKVIELGDASAFSPFYQTEYDLNSVIREYQIVSSAPENPNCILGVIEGDSVIAKITLSYADINVGEGIGLQIINATTTANNYNFINVTKNLGNIGIITKKTITAKIAYEKEETGVKVVERIYSAGEPILNGGVYEVAIKWNIYNKSGILVTKDFNVGRYELVPEAVNIADENNYNIVSSEVYVLQINPCPISEEQIVFEKNEFEYIGTDLSYAISTKASFTIEFDENNHALNLVFYSDINGTNKLDEIINAGEYYAKAVPTDINYTAEGTPLKKITVAKKAASAIQVILKKDGVVLNNGDTVAVEDKIELDFTGDDVALTQGYDGSYKVGSYMFTTLYENEKWYLIPIAGGDTATFKIEGVNATNYKNRISASFSLKTEKKKLYSILEKDQFFYGDKIIDELNLKYYYINEDGSVGREKPKSEIGGLSEAGLGLGTDVFPAGNYEITFSGGSSNGYYFEYYSSYELLSSKRITVKPKVIGIVVQDGGTKIYGEGEENEIIPYIIVYKDELGQAHTLDILPDGTKVVLNGKVGRTRGESVGEYDINIGTLASLNPNYEIPIEERIFNAKFIISKRDIVIAIKQNQGKEYGEVDERLEFEAEEGYEVVYAPEIGIIDTIEVFYGAYTITRAPGEDVGYYSYAISVDATAITELNYSVTILERDNNSYIITKAKPHVDFELTGKACYGDETNILTYRGSAENAKGETVEGRFSLYIRDFSVGGKRLIIEQGDTSIIAEFTPDDDNYETVKVSAKLNPEKRPVKVNIFKGTGDKAINANGASFIYRGKSISVEEFSFTVDNLVEQSSDFSITLTIEGDATNVTKDGFTVTASLTGDYYTLNQKATVKCTITKAIITVTAVNGSIMNGEKFSPIIRYEGFLGGDSKKNLIKQASVGDIPTESGYYALIPSGAEAQNYDFIYISGELVINRKIAESEGVKIEGELPPGCEISAKTLNKDDMAFGDLSDICDKELGATLFMPIGITLKEYISLSSKGVALDGEYKYTLLIKEFADGDKIYAKADGKIVEIDYEAEETEEGTLITFTSDIITGVAVYEKKTIKNAIIDYLPIAGISVGVLVILIGVICIIVAVIRKDKSKKHFAIRAKWR